MAGGVASGAGAVGGAAGWRAAPCPASRRLSRKAGARGRGRVPGEGRHPRRRRRRRTTSVRLHRTRRCCSLVREGGEDSSHFREVRSHFMCCLLVRGRGWRGGDGRGQGGGRDCSPRLAGGKITLQGGQFTLIVLTVHTFMAAGMENWRAFVDGASGRQQQHPGGRTPSTAAAAGGSVSRQGGGVGGGAGEGAAAADTSERHLI